MPRFYFDLSNGHRVPDHAGLDCDDETDAKQKADSIAGGIADQAEVIPKKHLTVVDEKGEDIYQAPIRKRDERNGNMSGPSASLTIALQSVDLL